MTSLGNTASKGQSHGKLPGALPGLEGPFKAPTEGQGENRSLASACTSCATRADSCPSLGLFLHLQNQMVRLSYLSLSVT